MIRLYTFYDKNGNILLKREVECSDDFNWSQSNYWKMLAEVKKQGISTSNYDGISL